VVVIDHLKLAAFHDIGETVNCDWKWLQSR